MTLLLFSFAVGPQSEMLRRHAPGYLWLGVLFSSTLLYSQSFQLETETNATEQLLLAPVAPHSLFIGKALANTVQLFGIMLVMIPPLVALCDVSFREGLMPFFAVLLVGALGLSAPGAMYAAMTARLAAKQLLMPLLLFPLIVPALLAAVKITSLIFFGDPMNQITGWFQLLIVFDVIFWSVCSVLFSRVMEL
jgi:heme exporter protein B